MKKYLSNDEQLTELRVIVQDVNNCPDCKSTWRNGMPGLCKKHKRKVKRSCAAPVEPPKISISTVPEFTVSNVGVNFDTADMFIIYQGDEDSGEVWVDRKSARRLVKALTKWLK